MSIRSTLRAALAALVLALAAPVAPAPAVAQDSLSSALQRLQQNPRYQGRVLGTHIRKSDQSSEGYVYEVRILRPDDRVVLVYVDPNGRVIGDSGRAQPRARPAQPRAEPQRRPPPRRDFQRRDGSRPQSPNKRW